MTINITFIKAWHMINIEGEGQCMNLNMPMIVSNMLKSVVTLMIRTSIH